LSRHLFLLFLLPDRGEKQADRVEQQNCGCGFGQQYAQVVKQEYEGNAAPSPAMTCTPENTNTNTALIM